MAVEELRDDCDGDALLVRVRPNGPACHTGSLSCFAPALWRTIAERAANRPEGSYTTKLLDEGTAACAQKVGEEAVEVVTAALAETDERLVEEAADLVYHLYVLLASRGLDVAAVEDELARARRRRRESSGQSSTARRSRRRARTTCRRRGCRRRAPGRSGAESGDARACERGADAGREQRHRHGGEEREERERDDGERAVWIVARRRTPTPALPPTPCRRPIPNACLGVRARRGACVGMAAWPRGRGRAAGRSPCSWQVQVEDAAPPADEQPDRERADGDADGGLGRPLGRRPAGRPSRARSAGRTRRARARGRGPTSSRAAPRCGGAARGRR